MAKHGFLNNVKHTGNTIQQLKLWGGQEYTNEAGYEEKQAVSDQNIVTANGTGQLEFCRELLLLLKPIHRKIFMLPMISIKTDS